jgi:hypothetical protein
VRIGGQAGVVGGQADELRPAGSLLFGDAQAQLLVEKVGVDAVGAAVADFSPPAFGAVANDPANCAPPARLRACRPYARRYS